MTYEYICTECGHQWEADQSIKDAALKECPQCHKQSAKRQISGGTGFVLKGGGWYADLYSSSAKPEAKRTEAESSTKSESTTSSTDSSSAAPAAKTEAKAESAAPKAKETKAAKTASE
jgi:putative FmdB family regulatory protein